MDYITYRLRYDSATMPKLTGTDFATADYYYTRDQVAEEYNKFTKQEINDLLKFLETYHNPANENITWR